MNKTIAPYGSWSSELTSDVMSQSARRLQEPQLSGDHRYWLESRPGEKGRMAIMRSSAEGEVEVCLPTPWSARSRVNEYGGASYHVDGDILYFVNDSDQRIYALSQAEECVPKPLSPEGHYRFSDLCIDHNNQRIIAVVEIHHDAQRVEHCIAAIALDGSSTHGLNLLVFGNDFYSNPRLSPDGRYLSWLTWHHPYMPWDSTECWIAELSPFGLLNKHRKVAGGKDKERLESVFQPQWSPTGDLYFVSDRSGWWNLYCYRTDTHQQQAIASMEAEFATPQWVMGMSTYGFLNSYRLFCCYTRNGQWEVATLDLMTHQFTPLSLPYTYIEGVHCHDEQDTAIFIAANDVLSDTVVEWCDHQIYEIRQSATSTMADDAIAIAEPISFTNSQQQVVHGFYYPPCNRHYQGPEAEHPPLIVIGHGGPTGATRRALSYKIQYWTQRGFAVADINYSGSTGYGRDYRERLLGQWGVLDVEELCAAATYLVQQKRANEQHLFIRGSSAGGYSVLAALTFHQCFSAGTSLYGISDLKQLVAGTHRFEARYLDRLIGPYPAAKAIYYARSPLFHAEQLTCPTLFLQGMQDKVVPPNQAQSMVNTLAQQGVAVAYETYEDEGHGFRQPATIRHSFDVEYAFYRDCLGLGEDTSLPVVPYVEQPECV